MADEQKYLALRMTKKCVVCGRAQANFVAIGDDGLVRTAWLHPECESAYQWEERNVMD